MSEILNKKDYTSDEFKELTNFFNYEHRIGTYYIFREKDGYINISYEYIINTNGPIEYFLFHKNHYQGIVDNNSLHIEHKKDIHFETTNFKEFEQWMCEYHKKQGRKYKLKKLNKNLSI
jgi:hypothetical protein